MTDYMSDDLRNRVARAIFDHSWMYDRTKPWTLEPENEKRLTYAMADAALAKMGAVRVKPLVWDEPCAANNHIYMARAPWGTYGIHIDGGRHRAWLEAYEKPYERWLGDDDVGSVYEAQSAAEDDHRARILAAIEPAPTVREAALIDASGELCSIVEGVQGSFNHGTWRDEKNGMRLKDTGEWARFYVALRAIAEGKDDD